MPGFRRRAADDRACARKRRGDGGGIKCVGDRAVIFGIWKGQRFAAGEVVRARIGAVIDKIAFKASRHQRAGRFGKAQRIGIGAGEAILGNSGFLRIHGAFPFKGKGV